MGKRFCIRVGRGRYKKKRENELAQTNSARHVVGSLLHGAEMDLSPRSLGTDPADLKESFDGRLSEALTSDDGE